MFCKNCGRRLGEGARFCGGCGTPVSAPAENDTTATKSTEDVQIEAVTENVQAEVVAENVQAEAVTEDVKAEAIAENVQAEAVAEDVQAEAVTENVQAEAVTENVQAEAVTEDVESEAVTESVQADAVTEDVRAEAVTEDVKAEAVTESVQTEAVTEDVQAEATAENVQAEAVAENVQAEAVTEDVQVENALPKSFEDTVGISAAAEPKKKKKKGRTGLIIGGAVLALAGAAAAVGYFCFSNQIMRLIKGDAGYAQEIERKSYSDYIFKDNELDFDEIDRAIASNLESALAMEQASDDDDENNELFAFMSTAALDELLEAYGDSEMKITADIEFRSFFKAIIGEGSSEYTDALRDISLIYRVQGGEAANKYTSVIKMKDSEILRAEQYDAENLKVLTVPELCDYTFYIESEEGEKQITVPKEEITRIRTEIYKITDEAYPSAEFTYTDGEFTVADAPVKGTEVKAFFSKELCGEIENKIFEFLKNDEFLRGLYVSATGNDVSEYEEKLSEHEKSEFTVTICNYIAPHTKIIGKLINVTDLSEEEVSFALGFVNTDEQRRFSVDTSDGGKLSVVSSSGTETSLWEETEVINTEIIFIENKDSAPLILDVKCENPGKITYCGKTIRTGSYTLSLSDKNERLLPASDENDETVGDMMFGGTDSGTFIEELLKSVKLKWSMSGSETQLKQEFSINISSMLSLSINAELTPSNASEAISTPDISGEKCINLAEDIDERTKNAIELNIKEKTLEAIEKDEALRDFSEKTGLGERLREDIEESKHTEKMLEHYSGYMPSSPSYARTTASDIYDEFTELFWEEANELDDDEFNTYDDGGIFSEPRAIKLYFSEQGVEVIDDGGMDFIDFDELNDDEEYMKNMYCELTFDFVHALARAYSSSYDYYYNETPVLTGVCVVYTDDPNDLPSALPDTYNYIDGVFEWGGEVNYKDFFVVGTYPRLEEGVSSSREEEEKLAEEKERLDGYALDISKAVQLFMRRNPQALVPENTTAFSLELSAGRWTVLNGYDELMRENGEIKKLAQQSGLSDYLKDFSRLSDISDVRVQLLFGSEAYLYRYYTDDEQSYETEIELIGVAVVNAKENVVFSEYYIPQYSDYFYGFSSALYPQAGKLYINDSYYTAFGSWCVETDTALNDTVN